MRPSPLLRPWRAAAPALAAAAWVAAQSPALQALTPEMLTAQRALPPEIAGRFRDPAGFQQAASGQYFVFDRRGHTVYGVDEPRTSLWEIVRIGAEPGRIIDPTAFSVAPDGSFAVADAPGGRERVQIFTPAGFRIGGFLLPDRARPRVILNTLVIGGIGSLQYTGSSLLMSRPELGGLIAEYTTGGAVTRVFGALRHTGHEDDRPLHLALNAGLPLVDPTGGFFFVFQTGAPAFRKYDAKGELVFERHIEGREIEQLVRGLPGEWIRRRDEEGELPLVTPTIRTAAVDGEGRLWISFVVPYTYVFDRDGDKIRTVQFRGAGIVAPDSLAFGPRGRLLVTPGLYEF